MPSSTIWWLASGLVRRTHSIGSITLEIRLLQEMMYTRRLPRADLGIQRFMRLPIVVHNIMTGHEIFSRLRIAPMRERMECEVRGITHTAYWRVE